MTEIFSLEVDGRDQVLTALNQLSEGMKNRILMKLQASADRVLQVSQGDVPVDTEDLKASGHVEPSVNVEADGSGAQFGFDVVYGDGSSTSTIYDYPGGNQGMKDVQADGYAWFTELGHLDRAGNPVRPQPYLGPAFDDECQNLLSSLGIVLDG